MEHGEIEAAFERWRAKGDLQALGAVIDRASPELLAIAARLAPDLAEAEDLVQAVFVALIEKPNAWDGKRPLQPWLVGILANQARKSARTSRRTPDQERLVERAVDEPHRVVLEEETRSAVRRALDELPPLYKEVVTRSVIAGERPHDIARALERAPGTVRMQLLRGLDMLRRALPAGLAGGGALVLAGTRGEAAIRTHVLSRAAELPRVATAAPLASIPVVGGLLVSTKLLVSMLVVAAALGTWLAWPAGDLDGGRARGASLADAGEAGAGLERDALARAEAVDAPRAPASTDAPAPPAESTPPLVPGEGWWVVGSVRGARAEDFDGIRVRVSVDGQGQVTVPVRADGTFEADLWSMVETPVLRLTAGAADPTRPGLAISPLRGKVTVLAQHPDYLSQHESVAPEAVPLARAAGERVDVRCDGRLLAAARASAIVRLEPKGEAEVRVDLIARELGSGLFVETVSTAHVKHGERFHVRGPRSGTYILQAASAAYAPAAARVKLELGQELELPDFVLVQGTTTIEGRVDLPAELHPGGKDVVAEPVAASPDAALPIFTSGWRPDLREVRGGAWLRQQRAMIAEDGSFRLTGLDEGAWKLYVADMPMLVPPAQADVVQAPARNVVIGARLGFVRLLVESGGKPVSGAHSGWSTESTSLGVPVDDYGSRHALVDRETDCRVSASVESGERASKDLPAAGRPRVCDVVLTLSERATPASLELVPPPGAPELPGVTVVLRALDGDRERTHRYYAPLENGRYRVAGLPVGRWNVAVGPHDNHGPPAFHGNHVMTERFELVLEPGGHVEQAITLLPGGRLRVRPIAASGSTDRHEVATWTLHDASGRSVEGPFVSQSIADGRGTYRSDPVHLSLHYESALDPCLAPGRYTLAIESKDWQAAPIAFDVVEGRTTEIELRLSPR